MSDLSPRWPRQGGAALCALVVILVFEGLQNEEIASERAFASEVEAMNLVISENIIVVQKSEEPQTGGVAAYTSNVRNTWVGGRAVVDHLRRVACPDHIFGEIFSGEKEGWGIDRVSGYHRVNDQFSYNSGGFPIIFKSVGDADVVSARNGTVFIGPRTFNEFDDLREVVFIDDNKKRARSAANAASAAFCAASAAMRVDLDRLIVKPPKIAVKIATAKVPSAVMAAFLSIT
jgi:hypothetical protein